MHAHVNAVPIKLDKKKRKVCVSGLRERERKAVTALLYQIAKTQFYMNNGIMLQFAECMSKQHLFFSQRHR